MKKALLIIGIIIAVACVISLICASFNWYGYRHVLDGAPSLYDRLHRRGIAFSVIGIVLAVIAAASFIFSANVSADKAAQTGDGPLSVDKLISYKLPGSFRQDMEYPYYGEDGNPVAEKGYTSKSDGYFSVGVLSYKGKDCISDETQTVSLDDYVDSLDRVKEITVDGETAYFGTRESDDMPDMVAVVYVSHGDYVFEFRLTNSDEQVTDEQLQALEKAVTSVKFKE